MIPHPTPPQASHSHHGVNARRLIAALVLALLTASNSLMAATTPDATEPREKAEAVLKHLAEVSPDKIARFLDQRMAAKLELTDGEITRVVAINLDYAQELHTIAASKDKVRVKVRAMSKENNTHQAEIKEVITTEQFTRFLAMKEELRDALKDLPSDK